MRETRLVQVLNGLIEICCDGSEAYEIAAQTVSDLRLKKLLRSLATERRAFAEELRQEVLRLGGQPQLRGTLRGALRRGWIHSDGAQGAPESDVLRQCVFGEQSSLVRYEQAVKADLPDDLNALVSRHFLRVNEVRSLIDDLGHIHS